MWFWRNSTKTRCSVSLHLFQNTDVLPFLIMFNSFPFIEPQKLSKTSKIIGPPFALAQFLWFPRARCHMVWITPLAHWGQLSPPSSSCTPSPLAAEVVWEAKNRSDHCASPAQSQLKHLFACVCAENSTFLLYRQLTLSQSKLAQGFMLKFLHLVLEITII